MAWLQNSLLHLLTILFKILYKLVKKEESFLLKLYGGLANKMDSSYISVILK